MKALLARGAGDLALVERPVPVPGMEEALVKVGRAGICHTDVLIRDGSVDGPKYPLVPGHEFAGVVESCGPAVKYIRPGDRVAVHQQFNCGQCAACYRGDTGGCIRLDVAGWFSDGGFAEYCAVPARHLFTLPGHVTLAEGAIVESLANAVSVVRQSRIRLGESVVVIGPGPIGLLALQVARLAHPSDLVLVGTRDKRLSLGQMLGATHTVNIRSEGGRDALTEALGERRADVVLVCAGSSSALQLATDIVGWKGRIAVEGVPPSGTHFSFDPANLLNARAVTLIGVNGWVTEEFAEAVYLLSSGLVRAKPLITHEFPLEEWETAFEMVTTRKSEAIKVEFAM